MPADTLSRRVTSTATTITVTGLPSWLPGAGQFGSISLSDASAINPSAIDPLYRGLWVGNSGGWNAVWDAYGGGLIRATSRRNGSAYEPTMMAIDVSKYVHGSTTTLTSYVLNMTAYPTGWPTSLKNGTYTGCKDKLEYCDIDGNVNYLERQAPGGTSCTLWKLVPPEVGQEQSGTWTWQAETINVRAGDSYASFACEGAAREPSWGGRARYVPALKSIVLTDKHNWPVQAVRSGSWL